MANLNASILDSYKKLNESALNELLAKEIAANDAKIIVLDDDPTGVQTVHGISVYTGWDQESICSGFLEQNKVFYILTNSRAMTREQTEKTHREIAQTVADVAKRHNKNYIIMSRSDSTMRGHYPLEPEILYKISQKNGIKIDGEIICPFFREGGRYTINNTHYVRYGDELVPAAKTEFAKDKTFGFSNSNLPKYVEEKTGGKYKEEDIACISLEDLRNQNIDKIERQLLQVENFDKIIVNAIDYCDLKVFCIAIYRALAKNKRFIFRTAAGLVKVLGGITDKNLLAREEMISHDDKKGGMIVVGSHTQKTTAQLNRLLELPNVVGIEFNSDLALVGDEALHAEVAKVVQESEKLIEKGLTPVCYTVRRLLTCKDDTPEDALLRSVKISNAVQSLVGSLTVRPAFVMAKGGITSSDVGVKALKVKRARVLGQIRPGIPVWQTDETSKFPGIPYVIFPGNVGEETTLKEACEILAPLGA